VRNLAFPGPCFLFAPKPILGIGLRSNAFHVAFAEQACSRLGGRCKRVRCIRLDFDRYRICSLGPKNLSLSLGDIVGGWGTTCDSGCGRRFKKQSTHWTLSEQWLNCLYRKNVVLVVLVALGNLCL